MVLMALPSLGFQPPASFLAAAYSTLCGATHQLSSRTLCSLLAAMASLQGPLPLGLVKEVVGLVEDRVMVQQ
ncbi:hypothetical protein HaLaN_32797, partial [Haematococcus lacustris]